MWSTRKDVLRVQLYDAILSGREAEVLAKTMSRGCSRRLKDEAVEGLERAWRGLDEVEDGELEKHRVWAEKWLVRLRRT